jgi:hypothetical protein
VTGGNVQKYQFIGPLGFISAGNLDWVARVTQIQKMNPLDNAAAINVKTGDNSLG